MSFPAEKWYVTEDQFRRDPPDSLYHYTTQEGVIGILGSRELWASDLRYLNDHQEFEYGVGLAKDLIAEAWQEGGFGDIETMAAISHELEAAKANVSAIVVASFSTNGDDLSQWRAYSGSATGYAVKFHSSYLSQLAREQGYSLVKCLYSRAEQTELLGRVIKLGIEEYRYAHANAGLADKNTLIADVAFHVIRLAPFLKHDTFEAECEWRLISYLSPVKFRPGLKFHHGRSTIVPHLSFKLIGATPIAIDSVVVGPCTEPNLARDAMQQAIETLIPERDDIYGQHKVISSSVPYRNW